MPLYGAFDLHAKTNHLGIIDGSGKRVLMKKLPNEASVILDALKPYIAWGGEDSRSDYHAGDRGH